MAAVARSLSPATEELRLVEATSPQVLFDIVRPDVNMVVWRRPCLQAQSAAHIPRGFSFEHVHRAGASGHTTALARVLPAVEHGWLRDDVQDLVERFAQVLAASAFAVRLSVVTSDACRKLHVDYVRMRLLCTYAGPGTELLEDRHADRSAFDLDEHDAARANARVAKDHAAIRSAQVGDVVLLKGETWPDNRGRGAIHRSPPIGEGTRVLLNLTLA